MARQELLGASVRVDLIRRLATSLDWTERGKASSLSNELGQPYEAADLTDSDELSECFNKSLVVDGRIDAFVNCVGSVLLKPAHLTTDAEFESTIKTNLFTSFAMIKAAIPMLREHGGGIVLCASAAAEIGIANHEAIAAAKAGVIGLARSAAATYAPNNIRVNVISPGLVKTELTRKIWETQPMPPLLCRCMPYIVWATRTTSHHWFPGLLIPRTTGLRSGDWRGWWLGACAASSYLESRQSYASFQPLLGILLAYRGWVLQLAMGSGHHCLSVLIVRFNGRYPP